MRCPYCRKDSLYIRRTSPVIKFGCRNCDKKVKILLESGMSKENISLIIKGDNKWLTMLKKV
ncbi:MAG: hypothetical protein FWC41_07690 [Firmicutes bacterium]|nr:hypothetical protein [Bacillota bacterium]